MAKLKNYFCFIYPYFTTKKSEKIRFFIAGVYYVLIFCILKILFMAYILKYFLCSNKWQIFVNENIHSFCMYKCSTYFQDFLIFFSGLIYFIFII